MVDLYELIIVIRDVTVTIACVTYLVLTLT